jgi:hypothetical protein
VPLPLPEAPPVMVIQKALDDAFHEQPLAADTPMVPLPPDVG